MNKSIPYDQNQFDWQRKAAAMDQIACANYESEDLLQAACYAWFKHYLRSQALIFAVPNGGSRGNKAEALKFVATGTVSGVSDLILIAPAKIIFIELKNRKKLIDPNQGIFQQKVEAFGFPYFMANTFNQFRCLIQHCLEISDELFETYV